MNVDYYNGISGIYFKSIISNIIKIGNLDKTKKIILDFGCGSKILSKKLTGNKILNYDINSDFTEHDDYKKLYFDIVVFNHVLMYMEKREIISTFESIKKILVQMQEHYDVLEHSAKKQNVPYHHLQLPQLKLIL